MYVGISFTKSVVWGGHCVLYKYGVRFTKLLAIILQLSYDNAEVTINLRQRLIDKTSYDYRKIAYDKTLKYLMINN